MEVEGKERLVDETGTEMKVATLVLPIGRSYGAQYSAELKITMPLSSATLLRSPSLPLHFDKAEDEAKKGKGRKRGKGTRYGVQTSQSGRAATRSLFHENPW